MALPNVYMGIAPRPTAPRQQLRKLGPYLLTATFLAIMLWWAQGMKKDIEKEQGHLVRPVPPAAQPRVESSSTSAPGYAPATTATSDGDWTQKIQIRPVAHGDTPDDDTAASCPTPSGNWAHTCVRDILIEGPCSRKCLLTAVCMDVHNKMQNTTFEYPEGEVVEVKNVNGLLCRLREDLSLSCGLNFHGNVAVKNCKGYVPRRHETRPDGLSRPDQEGLFKKKKPVHKEVFDCGPPPAARGVDYSDCVDTTVNGFCKPRCLPGWTGNPTALCTVDGWRTFPGCFGGSSKDAKEPKDTRKDPKRDWTHRLSLNNPVKHDDHPDDRNEETCPTPAGNWRHTCLERIVVEGPCNGKCLVKARCRNLNKTMQDTTFEFKEWQRVDVKNVNGLLCKLDEDGSPMCGMNFHGNLALKNCVADHIPRRREKIEDALPDHTEAAVPRKREDPQDEWRDRPAQGRRPRDVDIEEDVRGDRFQKKYDPVEWNRRGDADNDRDYGHNRNKYNNDREGSGRTRRTYDDRNGRTEMV